VFSFFIGWVAEIEEEEHSSKWVRIEGGGATPISSKKEGSHLPLSSEALKSKKKKARKKEKIAKNAKSR
jgi:uncharacterized protein YfaT (DUF1175 family)